MPASETPGTNTPRVGSWPARRALCASTHGTTTRAAVSNRPARVTRMRSPYLLQRGPANLREAARAARTRPPRGPSPRGDACRRHSRPHAQLEEIRNPIGHAFAEPSHVHVRLEL